MKIKTTPKGNKVVVIPSIHTYRNPSEFKHLHGKTIWQLSEECDILGTDVISINDKKRGVIVFSDPLKPNYVFLLSSQLDMQQFMHDEKYTLYSQFFFWTSKSGTDNICIARPNPILLNMVESPSKEE
jgi:hypothetical protein